MEKFNLLYRVLSDLHEVGILKHLILIGSWCQDFYRIQFGNPIEIPAAKTMDADLLLSKHMKIKNKVNIVEIMEKNDFSLDIEYPSGLYKFLHPHLTIEFITDPGPKAEEAIYRFKQLGITAQELRFTSILLDFHYPFTFKNITINIPEPEAFAFHKLLISERRIDKEKAAKDIDSVKGLFLFFGGKKYHINRCNEILTQLPKKWQKRIDDLLKKNDLLFPE